MLVVFIFLQSWRATLIPLLTVPVSLIGAFAVFPLLGFSINTLSLFGLVLAIGLVVDDAIVVVEAVEHHIEEGMAPREATLQGDAGGAAPVIGIALILAAVFIPVAFMAGITGRLYQQFALTIAISVLISAFNALTLSPALAAMLLQAQARPAAGPASARSGAASTAGFDADHRRLRRRSTPRLVRKLAIPLVLLLAASRLSPAASGRKLPSGFVPDEDKGYALIGVQLPDAASLQRTQGGVQEDRGRSCAKTEGVRTYNAHRRLQLLHRTAASYAGHGVHRASSRGTSAKQRERAADGHRRAS